jgi:beta-lactamase class A
MLICACFNALVVQAVMAISPADLSSVLTESELYTPNCSTSTVSSASGALPSTVPPAFATIFEDAASQYTVPPALVAAIFMEENGLENTGSSWPDPTSESWPTSSAGAEGPFQFLPSTFSGDEAPGKTDINNLTDAAYAAANDLASNGGKLPTPDLQSAILAYNHSQSYVNAVTSLYNQLGGASSASGGPSNGPANIDVSSVAKKYGLESAIVTQVGGTTLGAYQANQPPVTPASTMKLIIADTVLQSSVNLDEVIPVSPGLLYGGENDLPGSPSSISVGDALKAALDVSSNVGANVLLKALGGPDGFTSKANALGYNDTTVKFYYSPSDPPENKSTISDEVSAMNHILTTTGTGYTTAQQALQDAAKNDNYYGLEDEANKWAGTSQVAGNVGEFSLNGQQYIIGLYYNGVVPPASTDPNNLINQATNDLASLVQNTAGQPSSASSGGCCPASGSATVPGDVGSAGVYSGGPSGPPFIVEQYAINVLDDLAQKKGLPTTTTVTQQHVTALVAWALVEGGNIANTDLYNLYNTTENASDLGGTVQSTGSDAYPSFDQGVEATARNIDDGQHNPMLQALLDPNSSAEDFGRAESQSGTTPGTAEWAAAAVSEGPATYFSESWAPALANVRSDYKDTAGLLIGPPPDSLLNNKTDPSLLQFSTGGVAGAGGSGAGCSGTPGADAAGIVAEALSLAWPDTSHGATPTPAYQAAYNQYDPGGAGVVDCGSFVATVMHATGADKNYPDSGTGAQYNYVESSSLYTVQTLTSLDQLQPGDIVIEGGGGGTGAAGHTWIYVGKQPNGDYSASASLGTRSASLDQDPTNLDTAGGAPIYARLK